MNARPCGVTVIQEFYHVSQTQVRACVGDMHAPQGFGSIHFATLAAKLRVRPGTRTVIEIKTNFIAHAEVETLADAQAFGAQLAPVGVA